MKYNPLYDAMELKLDEFTFEQQTNNFSYNIIAFWSTEDGRVFCKESIGEGFHYGHEPFDDCAGKTQDEVLRNLDQVLSTEYAATRFDAWNQGWYTSSDRQELLDWVDAQFELAHKGIDDKQANKGVQVTPA